MEAALGGELRPTAFRTTDGSLDETALAAATYGALAGLQHLHSLRVVHGDLKLGNLLLGGHGGRCVKVADLGCAVRFPADLPPADWWVTNRPAGTPAYLAPEQTTEAPYLGPPADVWAMGVCLFQLASGRLPFHGDSIIGLYDAIAKCGGDGGPVQELVGEVSPPLEDLLRGMLRKEAAERLDLSEVMDHPWFSKQLAS
jgi:serine/threonine protein kinase